MISRSQCTAVANLYTVQNYINDYTNNFNLDQLTKTTRQNLFLLIKLSEVP